MGDGIHAQRLGAKRLDQLQVRDVQTWINQIAKTCQCCAQGKEGPPSLLGYWPLLPERPVRASRTYAGCDVAAAHAGRTCAALLVDLDVHPRVIMQVLRHGEIAVTMEIYSQASSHATCQRPGRAIDDGRCCT